MTLAETGRSHALGLGNVTEAFMREGARFPRHAHPVPRLTILRRGSFTMDLSRATFTCDTSGVFFKPAGATHSNRVGPSGASSIIFELTDPRWLRHGSHGDLPGRTGLVRTRAARHLAGRVVVEFDGEDAASDLALEGLALELLAEVFRAGAPAYDRSRAPRWLSSALDRLKSDPAEKITMSSLAKEVGVHPNHLARTVRDRFGVSVGHYRRNVMLDRAASLLVETDQPLSGIALACGFYDQSHFSRSFTRRFGTPPGSYREKVRRPGSVRCSASTTGSGSPRSTSAPTSPVQRPDAAPRTA